jgi:two-component system, OmpR family, KDP operon response regulator KdpE
MVFVAPTPIQLDQVDVLVVDDDASIRAFVREALEDEGYNVATASTGPQALTHVATEHPRLVLLDLHMPSMSGWQVHDWLQRWHVEVPVVYMSADPAVRAEARRHQAAGSLPKPFGLDELLNVVERHTSHPQP